MKMFEAVEQTPVRGEMRIHIAPRSKRPKKGRCNGVPVGMQQRSAVPDSSLAITV